MKKNTQLPILIVGGGIGGAMTAIALSRKGIPSIVLEQANQFREIGGGIQLCPNVFKMFEYFGLTKVMKKIAYFPDNLIYMDGVIGQPYAKIPLGETLVSRFKYPYGVFHRAEFLSTLINECKKSPLIKLVTSTRIVDIEEKEGKIFAETSEDNIFEGEALIGCDGMWSVVRDYVIGKTEPRVSRSMSYRALIPLDQIPEYLRPNDVVHWHRPNSHLVHYPISTKGLFNIVAEIESEIPQNARDIVGNPAEIDALFADSPPSGS